MRPLPYSILLSILLISTSAKLHALSEASGITWNRDTESYFVVGDEGHVYELDRELRILRSVLIGPFDLEAITYDYDRNRLICLDESTLSLIELDQETFVILNIYPLILEREKKREYRQFESLVYSDQTFYIAASTTEKKEKFGTLFFVTLGKLILEPLEDIPLWDISGMSITDGIFFFISDDKDILARYSPNEDTFETLVIPGNHQEGLILTEKSELLIIDEDGSSSRVPLSEFSSSN